MRAIDMYVKEQANATNKIVIDNEISRHKVLAKTAPEGEAGYLKSAMQVLREELSTTFLFTSWSNYNFGDMFSDPNIFSWIDSIVEEYRNEVYEDYLHATNDSKLSVGRADDRSLAYLKRMFDGFFIPYHVHYVLDFELKKLINSNERKKSFRELLLCDDGKKDNIILKIRNLQQKPRYIANAMLALHELTFILFGDGNRADVYRAYLAEFGYKGSKDSNAYKNLESGCNNYCNPNSGIGKNQNTVQDYINMFSE